MIKIQGVLNTTSPWGRFQFSPAYNLQLHLTLALFLVTLIKTINEYLNNFQSCASVYDCHTAHSPASRSAEWQEFRIVLCSDPSVSQSVFTITGKAPTRAFSWFKAPTSAFTFKTLLRHYANQALTPRSLNVKLGPRRKGHKGRANARLA